MISIGTTHDNGGRLAAYFVTSKPGERADLWQLRGFASDDIKDAFRSIHVMAAATRCEQPLFHTFVRNPEGEHLSRDQWERVADRIESKLGLTDQPRAIAFHRDDETGHEHMHIGWSRIDEDTMTAKALPFFKLRLKEVSRELETELGLTPVRNEREGPAMAPRRDEDEQARRLGVDIRQVRATIRECWERADNGQSFAAALSDKDLTLARGDRRDFIAIDHEGGIHALGKRILGNTAGEVRARMTDLDREQLPTIEQAREKIAARREAGPEKTVIHASNLAWEEAVKKAANESTRRHVVEPAVPTPTKLSDLPRDLDESALEISRAYRAAGTAAVFAGALDRSGIRLAAVTPAEAKDGIYRAGEIVAVNQSGQVYKLDESTTSRNRDEVQKSLVTLDRRELCGIEATQNRIYLEGRLHMELGSVGALDRDAVPTSVKTPRPPGQTTDPQVPNCRADDPLPDWERMQMDRTYRRQVEQKDRERRAADRQEYRQSQPRGRDRER